MNAQITSEYIFQLYGEGEKGHLISNAVERCLYYLVNCFSTLISSVNSEKEDAITAYIKRILDCKQ